MKKKAEVHIGTSGWHYQHWVGPFYPKGTKSGQFIDFYKQSFSTVEINNSFYRLPEKETFANWKKQVPKNFLFAVKASRYITHIKRLLEPKQGIEHFLERAEVLGKNLGPILFQLPPNFKLNLERLEDFLQELPKGGRFAFEFRNDSWFIPEVYALLKKHNVAFCMYELNSVQTPKEITADFIYIRLHGPGKAYQGQYKQAILNKWAEDFKKWQSRVKDIYCYFDNDERGYAAKDAKRLLSLLEK